jgi:hypothetical protein
MEIPPNEDQCYVTKSEFTNIIAAIRVQFSRSVFADKCRALRISKTKGPRGGTRYDCDDCHMPLVKTKTELHHIAEVIEIGKHYYDYTLNEIIARLWCGLKGVALLCHKCHYDHYTVPQNKLRQEFRDAKKARREK